jgi:hypothetical protein
LKIEFEGRGWDVDLQGLSLEQAVVITGRMGLSLTGWEKTLADPEDPQWLDAMRCLYWLMRQQDGDRAAIGDVDFAVLRYATAVGEAIERETPAAVPQDPTKPPATPAGQPAAEDSIPAATVS